MQVVKLKFMRENVANDLMRSFGAAFPRLLPEEEIFLLKGADTHSYDAGETVIKEGSRPGYIFVIEEGTARVLRTGAGGGRVEIVYLGRGDVFGEMAFVDNAPASASVVADTAVRALCIPAEMIQALMMGDLGFAGRFYHSLALTLAERLRDTTRRHIDFAPRAEIDRRRDAGNPPAGIERRAADRRRKAPRSKKNLPLI